MVQGVGDLELVTQDINLLSFRGKRLVKSLNSFTSQVKDIPEENRKVFLTHYEFSKCFQTALHEIGMRCALIFAMQWLLALRSIEVTRVAIQDFWLDPHTGYLQTDERGVGRLFFPAVKSKGGYGPSHPVYGTKVDPYLVRFLNEKYLPILYSECPYERLKNLNRGHVYRGRNGMQKVYPEGHSYLIPKEMSDPTRSITDGTVQREIKRLAKKAHFLPEQKRVNLSSHDGRHSVYDWITSAYYLPKDLLPFIQEVADLTLRHNMNRVDPYSQTNKGFRVTDSQYTEVMFWAVFGPWDQGAEAVKEWESERNVFEPEVQRVPSEAYKELGTVNVTKSSATAREIVQDLLTEIEVLNVKLNDSRKAPKTEVAEWLSERKLMLDTKAELEKKIRELNGL